MSSTIGGPWSGLRPELRFLVVGALSVVIDFSAYVALYAIVGLPATAAAAAAFLCALPVNFGLNRAWTFGAGRTSTRQVRRYLVLVALNLALTTVLVGLLVHLSVDYRIAKLAATAVVVVVNFVAQRFWVFAP